MCTICLQKAIRYCWEKIRPKKWKDIPYLWIAFKLLEQLDIHMVKSKFWTLSHNIHKNYLEVNHRHNVKVHVIKLPGENILNLVVTKISLKKKKTTYFWARPRGGTREGCADGRLGAGGCAPNLPRPRGWGGVCGQRRWKGRPPVWMRGYRVRAEASLIGSILPSGLYLSLLGSSFSPSTFAKSGAFFPALRSLQKESSLNPRQAKLSWLL